MYDFSHAEMVRGLSKPGEQILNEMTSEQAELLHMAVGVAGEAGELLDAVKKFAIYQKSIDAENIMEELGDLEFYLERIRQMMNFSRESTLEYNIEKLGKRYKGHQYSNEQAQSRADKA